MRIQFILILVAISSVLGIPEEVMSADQEDLDILGVFGIAPVPERTAVAIWVPLGSGSSISGVRWFHNDAETSFPRISAMAGEIGRPGPLDAATLVATNASGPSCGWSECAFAQPLASQSDGIYVVFELPVDGDIIAEGLGGGAGIGYVMEGQGNPGWITADGMNWSVLAIERQMAILPLAGSEKSASPHVLAPGRQDDLGVVDQSGDQANSDPSIDAHLLATPNPFNPETELRFELSTDADVTLTVFDLKGRRIRGLLDERLTAGQHRVSWNGKNDSGAGMASGVYLMRLRVGAREHSLRVTLSQ